jgi:hypothetical protein
MAAPEYRTRETAETNPGAELMIAPGWLRIMPISSRSHSALRPDGAGPSVTAQLGRRGQCPAAKYAHGGPGRRGSVQHVIHGGASISPRAKFRNGCYARQASQIPIPPVDIPIRRSARNALRSTSSPGCRHRPEAERRPAAPEAPGRAHGATTRLAHPSPVPVSLGNAGRARVDRFGRVVPGDARLEILIPLSRRRGEPFPRPHGHRPHVRARSGMPPAVERRDDETHPGRRKSLQLAVRGDLPGCHRRSIAKAAIAVHPNPGAETRSRDPGPARPGKSLTRRTPSATPWTWPIQRSYFHRHPSPAEARRCPTAPRDRNAPRSHREERSF